MSENRRYLRRQRLRTADIAALLSGGRAVKRAGVSVASRANGLDVPRLGLIVPKRVLPRAVDRNRAKRMLREWFRCTQTRLGNRDVLIRVIKGAVDIKEVEKCLAGASWAER